MQAMIIAAIPVRMRSGVSFRTVQRDRTAHCNEMALVGGSRVETVQDGENTLAVKTDVVVDTESGLLVERKTVVAEVLTESGNHKAILVGQQTTVRAVVRNTCVIQIATDALFFLCSPAQGLSTEVSKCSHSKICLAR